MTDLFLYPWPYLVLLAFALLGYAFGWLGGYRVGRKRGFIVGRVAGDYWARWKANND